jgi:hypothetical protein
VTDHGIILSVKFELLFCHSPLYGGGSLVDNGSSVDVEMIEDTLHYPAVDGTILAGPGGGIGLAARIFRRPRFPPISSP